MVIIITITANEYDQTAIETSKTLRALNNKKTYKVSRRRKSDNASQWTFKLLIKIR